MPWEKFSALRIDAHGHGEYKIPQIHPNGPELENF
jgi:hypothetical protein